MGLITEIKNAIELVRQADKATIVSEMRLQLAEIRIALSEALTKASELEEENRRLKGDLQKKADFDQVREALEAKDDAYFFKPDCAGGRPTGPYCPNCVESGRLTILKPHPEMASRMASGRWRVCRVCVPNHP